MKLSDLYMLGPILIGIVLFALLCVRAGRGTSIVIVARKDTGEHLAPNGNPIDGYPRQQA